MERLGEFWRKLAGIFRRRQIDRDLEEEMRFHLEMKARQNQEDGMPSEEARYAAQRQFGNGTAFREASRDAWAWGGLDALVRDVRYGFRGFARNPGFTFVAVFSLALGIGANTAIFSLVRTLMLRMLPVRQPEQLVNLYRTGGWGRGFTSYPLYLDIAKRSDVFEGVVARTAVRKSRFSRPGSGGIELAGVEYVTGNYFSLLGVQSAIGRLFSDNDNRTPGAHPVAVLSYGFWRDRFHADPDVLGATLRIDERFYTVIGVAAAGFRGVEVEHHPDVWLPCMMYNTTNIMNPAMHWVWIIGRSRPEVSRERMQSVVDAVMQQHLTQRYGNNSNDGFRQSAFSQRLKVYGADAGISSLRFLFGKALLVLLATVALVLLAACANLANLLLARGATRQREMALRLSLGATRARLVRQAFTESLLISALGCVLGILFAVWGGGFILAFLPAEWSEPFSLTPDAMVLAFTTGIALLATLLFGLAPAWRSAAIDPAAGLGGHTRYAASRSRLHRAIAVTQVALSVVLVALAGLFGGSLGALRSVDVGFRNQNVLQFRLDCPPTWNRVQRQHLVDHFVDRVSELPGVSSVSYGFPGPFEMGMASATIRVPGSPATAQQPVEVAIASVAPRYFDTIGAQLIAGREFDHKDTETSRKVAVVDEAFARMFLPGITDAVGRAVSFDGSKPGGGELTYIVGVVHNVRHEGLHKNTKPTVYSPQTQPVAAGGAVILVRAQAPPVAIIPELRKELAHLGAEVLLTDPQTIRQHIDDSIFQERLLATLSGFFGVLALLLAAIGLYGVVAYGTAQRTGEIGVRIALGARRASILWMVLHDALRLVSAGLLLGLPVSVAATRAIRSTLDEVPAASTAMFAATAAVLLAVGLAAAFFPARRAATIDPMRALRQE